MEEVARIIQGLRIARPSVSISELLEMDSPSPTFEAHVAADVGKDFWIYTANGSLLEGEAMVVRASKFFPDVAEMLASEGLRDTINAAKKFDMSTGLQITAEKRGVDE